LQHHRAEEIRIKHQFAATRRAHFAIALQFFKSGDKRLEIRRRAGVDDHDVIEAHALGFGRRLDRRPVAEQDGCAQLERCKPAGCLQNARLGALWKDHPLGVTRQFFKYGFDEAHATHTVKRFTGLDKPDLVKKGVRKAQIRLTP